MMNPLMNSAGMTLGTELGRECPQEKEWQETQWYHNCPEFLFVVSLDF
jgi:hypothetical protein